MNRKLLVKLSLCGSQNPNKKSDFNTYIVPIFKAMNDASFSTIKKRGEEECFDNSNSKIKIFERNYIISMVYYLGKQSKGKYGLKEIANGEVVKTFGCNTDFKENEVQAIYKLTHKNNRCSQKISYIPDLLIHDSNNKNITQKEKQHLILEAKTTIRLNQNQFAWDFCKLNLYQKYLNFRNAIYLIINTDLDKVNEYLNEYLEKYSDTISENGKLYFLVQKNIGSEIEICEFKKKVIIMENEFRELKGKYSLELNANEKYQLLNDMRSNLEMRIHAMSLNVDEYNLNSENVEELYKIDGKLRQLKSSKILTKIGEEYLNRHKITNNE